VIFGGLFFQFVQSADKKMGYVSQIQVTNATLLFDNFFCEDSKKYSFGVKKPNFSRSVV